MLQLAVRLLKNVWNVAHLLGRRGPFEWTDPVQVSRLQHLRVRPLLRSITA